MYSESQFPYITKLQVSLVRNGLRYHCREKMPHIPDDIFLHIMSFIEKDYIAARDEPPTKVNDEMAIWQKNGIYERGYDLPAFVHFGVGSHWFINGKHKRLYGLPAIINEGEKLSWFLKNREITYRKRKRMLSIHEYGASIIYDVENVDEPKVEIVF